MEILPTVPDLDANSSSEFDSVVSDTEENDDDRSGDDVGEQEEHQHSPTPAPSTTTVTTIKPGGEDNEPIPPTRSISPVSSVEKLPSRGQEEGTQEPLQSKQTTSKHASHRKMSQKPRLANPLDAFDTSPTPPSDSKKLEENASSSSAAIKPKRSKSPVPPMSKSSGAAGPKGMIRGLAGPPLTNNNHLHQTGGSSQPRLTRRMPNRSSLKATNSFNVGHMNQHLRSALKGKSKLKNNSNNSQEPNIDGNDGKSYATGGETTLPTAVDDSSRSSQVASLQSLRRGEPTRGVMRSASMPVPRSRKLTTIEVRVRGERFPVQRRRHIDFHQRVEIKEVEPVPDMVPGDEIWLQEEDFVKMKEDRKNTVRQIKKQQQLQLQKQHQEEGGSDHTPNDAAANNYRPGGQTELSPEQASQIRGLEKYVDKSIRAAKNMAWDTVLLEQDEQELSGDYNDERIADLYRHAIKESPAKALNRAKNDEEEIQDYLWSPRTTKLMLRSKVRSPVKPSSSHDGGTGSVASVSGPPMAPGMEASSTITTNSDCTTTSTPSSSGSNDVADVAPAAPASVSAPEDSRMVRF